MPDQMPVAGSTTSDLAHYRALFQSDSLRALSTRDVLMNASRFERRESNFLARYQSDFTSINTGVLASLSSQVLTSILRLYLFAEGFSPRITPSEFDGISANALD